MIERLVEDEIAVLVQTNRTQTIVTRIATEPTYCSSVSGPEVVTVVANLLSNAVRYSPPGTVEVAVDVRGGDIFRDG
ncbi:MAG: hypothetical protein R2706_14160 [Acidimicrobiales bacterium]